MSYQAPRSLIEAAVSIASEAHCGHTDKAGEPYILHPLRVMHELEISGASEEERIVGVLHDVVEHSKITFDELRRKGFPAPVITALDAISRREDETYDEYIDRCAEHPIARTVKRYDVEDNLKPERLANLSPGEAQSLERRYHKAQAKLMAASDDAVSPTIGRVLPFVAGEPHRLRHVELHNVLDELMADYLCWHPGKHPSNTTLGELMQWSHRQTIQPMEPSQDLRGIAR